MITDASQSWKRASHSRRLGSAVAPAETEMSSIRMLLELVGQTKRFADPSVSPG